LQTVSVPVSANDILNLASTPKVILPGVPGVSYIPQFATLAYIPGTKGYVDSRFTNNVALTSVDSAVTTTYSLTAAVPNFNPGDYQHTKYNGSISGGGSNAYLGYLARVSGFGNASNNGLLYIDASGTSLVSIQNPAGVAETHAGTLTVGTAVYHGTITGGDSDGFAGFWFIINSFANPANNGLFYCLASDATSLTLANVAASAETAGAIANAMAGGSGQRFSLAWPVMPIPSAGGVILPFEAPLSSIGQPSEAVTWLCGSLVPQVSYQLLPNLNAGGGGSSAVGKPIVLLLYNNASAPVALTGGDGTFVLTMTYLQVSSAA